jgi:imidazolonepropionase-like amidohydrolase
MRVDGTDSLRFLSIAEHVGLPILAGTDVGPWVVGKELPGFTLHAELAIFATEGLKPLTALQAATLNPAKLFHATDSLGTVAPGKLADLVLLDADPLADITNTTTIRAVVANGRYFDRAALDQLMTAAQAQASEKIDPESGLEPTP